MFKKVIGKVGGFFANAKKKVVAGVVACGTFVATSVTAFAADPPTVAVDSAMLEPVLEGAASNIGVVLPVAIGLFVMLLGIEFIPRIFKMFKKS